MCDCHYEINNLQGEINSLQSELSSLRSETEYNLSNEIGSIVHRLSDLDESINSLTHLYLDD